MKPNFPLAIFIAFYCSFFFVTGIDGADVFNRNLVINENYTVDWTVDLPKKNVTFTVTAKTKGWVGFGISPQGGMNNADVVIGGVQDKTVAYFTDRFATGKQEPKVDDEQNWHLISASESDTHTTLKFWRNLNTCDDKEDLPITSDTTKFIWSYGETDKIEQHASRGTAAVGILDSEVVPTNTSEFKTWNITVNTKIPTRDTAYWCTFHKRPSFRDGIKRHIVGFQVLLNNPESLEFNHHLIFHKCMKDPTIFSKDHPEGGECYDEDGTGVMQGMMYCQSVIFVWAKGGLPLFLPEDVGIPLFADESNPDEYYALQIHYDNPKVLPNVQYETGVQVLYVDKVRPKDAGIFATGHKVEWTQVVPPASTDFVTVGHCSSNCSKQHVPPEGLNIFNVLLHSHIAGRKLKLRHFRGQEELPWIAYDDSYNFDYQQSKPLREDVKFLPGDQLTYECTYATSNVTIGGLAIREEMCVAFIMYWPKLPKLDVCDSSYVYDNLFQSLNVTAEDFAIAENAREPIVIKYENRTWTDFLTHDVNWTDSFRTEFKRANRYDQHYDFCFSFDDYLPPVVPLADEGEVVWTTVTYPKDFKEYVPLADDECKGSSFKTSPQFLTLFLFTSLSFLFSFSSLCR